MSPSQPSSGSARFTRRMLCRAPVIFALLAVVTAPSLKADDHDIEFFEKRIRPILVRHCYECHSTNSKSPKGGLRLDTREGIRQGGESGPAVVPGHVDESLLIQAIRYESLEMPPTDQLPDTVVADFVRWIETGASDPRETHVGSNDTNSWQATLNARRNIWSLQPLQPVAPPNVAGNLWSDHDIDQFIIARLRDAGLEPAPAADRYALIRRLSFAVTGLPPAPQEVEAFVGDSAPHAWERLVDQLLSSPHFGERWARHWMDVVRFSETHGHEWNFEIRGAWRYRDYLIRAFNQDLPYDQLIREHIAGDLLENPRWDTDQQINESLTATAFYRFGEVGHDDCLEFREISLDVVDNQIDTLSKAFQGMTVACARCHDHKLDAVSMRDYYALSGILSSSRCVALTIDAPDVNDAIKQELTGLKSQIRRELADLWIRDVEICGEYLLSAQLNPASTEPDTANAVHGNAERLTKWRAAFEVVPGKEPALESPLYPWYRMMQETSVTTWQDLKAQYATERQLRSEFNRQNFVSFGDFRAHDGDPLTSDSLEAEWHADGLGMVDARSSSGEFSVLADGERVVQAILPAGFYTHLLSNRLNGALRSPFLPKTKKFLSLRVLGSGDSGLRTIHDNCHLNVAISLLDSERPKWITTATAHEYAVSHSYAALVTRFNNQGYPKYNTPERVDSNNIRSWFGVTQVVLHDDDGPPKDELTHLTGLFAGPDVSSRSELAQRFSRSIRDAVSAWATESATDEDVYWLDWLLQNELITNSIAGTERLSALIKQYRETEVRIPPPKLVNGMIDLDQGFDVPLKVRGNAFELAEPVPRRYLEVLANSTEPLDVHGSGRRELAELIASAKNPLTARVMVNRVWHHLFGNGIVRTTDDFGSVGDPPTHPELLDFLANRFIDTGWSIKQLIRTILISQTFQMSSQTSPAALNRDPENRLLHHFPLRRLDAECIRDAILAVSTRLDPTMYGESIDPWRTEERLDRRLFRGPLDGNGRRSVYLKFTLNEEPPFLTVFNLPEPKVARGRRDVTSVPAQALTLLNDPFVHEQAEFWAARLVGETGSVSQRIERMFLQALGRPPLQGEVQRFVELVNRLSVLHGIDESDVLTDGKIWKDTAHAVFNIKEFIYVR